MNSYMKTKWFVVVDAGGNIYEHTFAKEKGQSIKNLAFKELGVSIVFPETLSGKIQFLKERGDREVECEIETNETVNLTLK